MKIKLTGSMKDGTAVTSELDLSSAQPIAELARGTHKAWICHAEITSLGNVTSHHYLPAIRFVALLDGRDIDADGVTSLDEIRARFMLWNGEFSERVSDPFRFGSLVLSIGDGPAFHEQTATDDPRDLVVTDGSFILIGEQAFGQKNLGISPLEHHVKETYAAVSTARPTSLALNAALTRKPWLDYVRDTNQQGSPGSVTALLDEGCVAAVALFEGLGDAAAFESYLTKAEDAAAFNASQCGRRRLNYFHIAPNGRLELFTSDDAKGVDYDESQGLRLGKFEIAQDSWVIRDPGKQDTKDGEMLGSKYAQVVRAWDEQHEFRLLRHAYMLAFFPDPLIWIVANSRAQAVMTSPFFQNPNDGNGNQRRAWMLDSLAEFMSIVANGGTPEASAVAGQIRSAIEVAVVRAFEGRGATVNAIDPDIPVRWLTENRQPGRGHYGNTIMAFQVAVQVNAHARVARLGHLMPIDEGDARVYALRCMRHAALCLDDMATMRQSYPANEADGNGDKCGKPFFGTTAYDCDTREGMRVSYVNGPGGGFHSTFRWVVAARARAFLYDLESGQPRWMGRALGIGPELLAYFEKSDALRPSDSQHFHIGEAVHLAAALVKGGLHPTGYRE